MHIDKISFIGVHLLACYISVNIPKCTEMEHIKFKYPATASQLMKSMEHSPSWRITGPSASQKISTFYETPRLITVFTKACHLPLSWVR